MPSARVIFHRLLEASVLLLMVLSPWALGGAEPIFEFVLYAGLVLLALLAGVVAILERGYRWSSCPLLVAIALFFVLCLAQLMPLPGGALSSIAPSTASLHEELLPEQDELLPLGQQPDAFWPPPGTTLTLYPHATRQGLLRLLAVLVLFYLVRNYAASGRFLRRAAIAAVANGAGLSLFALLHFFSAERGTVYWTIPSLSEPFGPFVCRNHFPFYINICIGLGIGLMLYERGYRWSARQQSLPGDSSRPRGAALRPAAAERAFPWSWLERSPLLWLSVSLTLMIAAVALSLSRGGLLSLAATSLVAVLIHWTRSTRMLAVQVIAVALGTSVLLIGWLGSERVERRMATLYRGQAFQESRLPLWTRSLRLVPDFPLWGTGLGTFQFVEPLSRREAADANIAFDHAHNDYVEALVEGGLLRLAFSLGLIALMYRLGYRALAQHGQDPLSGLLVGTLIGLTTVVIHSVGDFGLHVPAITILVIVLSAQLAALADPRRQSAHARQSLDSSTAWQRLSSAGSLLAGTSVACMAILCCHEGWNKQAAKSLEGIVDRLSETDDRESREAQIAVMQAAVDALPTDALLRSRLAQLHLALFQDELEELASGTAALPEEQETIDARGAELVADHLAPGLKQLVVARNLCPILPDAQTFLAANVERFERADSLENYLRRAKRLLPSDAASWFLFGQQELVADMPAAAWRSWRHCLHLSDAHLPQILNQASLHLSPPQLLDRVLPERPEVLLAAASHAYPATNERQAGPLPAADRQLFLQAALRLLEESPQPLAAAQWRTKAQVHHQSGNPAAALNAYLAAVELQPQQVDWRFELASLLAQQGQQQEASRQLRQVLARQPGHAGARQLLAELTSGSAGQDAN